MTFLSGPEAAGTLLGSHFYGEGPSTTQLPAKDTFLVPGDSWNWGSLIKEHPQVRTTPEQKARGEILPHRWARLAPWPSPM